MYSWQRIVGNVYLAKDCGSCISDKGLWVIQTRYSAGYNVHSGAAWWVVAGKGLWVMSVLHHIKRVGY